ncbi:MAG: putative 3-hydroxyacyl-CoA dehydrogenase [Alphaproteobacteria bacterium MarineAlpha5_Bin6]|nr:MAG: putative 3-hydroxyacyl-CoA dehydrogenase [Alphaproteobacteria bacterium MarineAlpha5_Bin7]PPR53641.1 MAG: putative 3-hydroxyacyl-CoA dehydrogenase [Alphaproteobacteria bacterium MarineAlpha5_Bin6]
MIKKITVIGSGLMGSAIAAHFANVGCEVNLLDIVDQKDKNRSNISSQAINNLLKIKPSPFTLKSNINLIKSGNIEDDLNKINESDWVIEVIIENLNIKKELYKKIEKIMNNDLIISSNTSTFPINQLTEGLSLKFKKNFLITHFFNPPRYLKLLEIVKSKEVDIEIFEKIKFFCDINLGKTVIETKDTAGFIGNRIGIFWIERAAVEAINYNLSVEEADVIIKNLFGVPKTGVFGLIDVVGLDLIPLVVQSLLNNIPANDYYKTVHKAPEIFQFMLDNKLIGRKGTGGFYKLVHENNKKIKHSLNLNSKKYSKSSKPNIQNIKLIKKDINSFLFNEDKYSKYALSVISDVLYYVLRITEEISHDILDIDEAMKSGFGWKYGPFELMDEIGPFIIKDIFIKSKKDIPTLLDKITDNNFYKVKSNEINYYDFQTNKFKVLKRPDGIILLSDIKKIQKPIIKINTASLWDIGNKVTVFEFHSKSNTIDMATLEFLSQSIDIVSTSYKSMIIYNEGDFFSAGANLGEALFLGNLGLDSEVEKNILKKGQEVYSKLKYSEFPVISAPFNLALGGGCEILLHSNFVQAHIESYIGLTEAALGILPAWGGCKELLSRFSKQNTIAKGPMPPIIKTFELIGMAKVSTSAHEAKKLGYLKNIDGITMNRNRLLYDAKMKAIELSKDFIPPKKSTYNLPGKTSALALTLAINSMRQSGQISDYDKYIGEKIAFVLSGGDTDINKELSEENILNLEKNVIYELMSKNLTLERLEHVLETGKYLRN